MGRSEAGTDDQARWEARRPARELRMATAMTLIGGSSYVALAAGLVRSLIVMRLIGPHGRGIQRMVGMWKGYLSTLTIAFRHGASKELPLAIGAGDRARAAQVEDAVFLSVTSLTALTALGVVLYGILLSTGSRETRVAWCVGGGLLLAEDLAALYWAILRSWGRFRVLARGELVRTVAQFVLMIGGAYYWGVTGVMVGWLAGALTVLAYLDRASALTVRPRAVWSHIWRLARIGLPVALISFSDVLLRSIDGTVLVRFYGEERFGLYSVAMQMATYMYALPQAVNFVLWPKVIQSYGAGENEQRRRRRVLAPTLGLAALLPVGGGLAWVLMPAAVDLLVPKFAPSVPATQVLGLGSTFLALPLATNAALVGGDQEITVIATKLIGAAVIGGGTWRLVRRQGSLVAVATVTCAGYALAALLSLCAQMGGCYRSRLRLVGVVLSTLAPTAWVAGALWLTHRAVAGLGLVIARPAGALLAAVVFLVLSIPCLIWADRRTGALHELGAVLHGRLRH